MGKRLYRSRTDRMVAGVCGGLSDYLGIDPTMVRIVTVVLALWGGIGAPLYILMWLIVPEAPEGLEATAGPGAPGASGEPGQAPAPGQAAATGGPGRDSSSEPAVIIGVALIALGAIFLMRNLGIFWLGWLDARFVGPTIIIALGIFLLVRRTKGE